MQLYLKLGAQVFACRVCLCVGAGGDLEGRRRIRASLIPEGTEFVRVGKIVDSSNWSWVEIHTAF